MDSSRALDVASRSYWLALLWAEVARLAHGRPSELRDDSSPSRSDSPLETSGSFSAWCVEIGPARISTMESPHVMGANVSSGEPSRVDCRTRVDSTGAALSQLVSLDHTKAERVATDSSVRVTISRNNEN